VNFITDKLPTEYGGYKINTSFTVPLKFLSLQQDGDLSEREKTYLALKMFFPEFEGRHVSELLDFLPYYINRGRDSEEQKGEPVFDLIEDSERVYAAFLQVYHMDLHEADLHWWEFLALLENLPSGTKLAEIVGIRAAEVPRVNRANQKQVSALLRLKDTYALKGKKTIGEKMQDVWEAL
jgi:hypothetical protein